MKEESKVVVESIARTGVVIYAYLSAAKNSIIVLLKITEDRMRKFAEHSSYKMRVNPAVLEAITKETVPGREIRDDPNITIFKPYDYIYARYDYAVELKWKKLYQCPESPNSIPPFGRSDRLRLLYQLIVSQEFDGGADFEMSSLLKKKVILAFFPLTDLAERDELRQDWLRPCEFMHLNATSHSQK
jgi:hypothetical protein